MRATECVCGVHTESTEAAGMSESLRLSRLAEQSSVDLVCDAGSAGAGGDKDRP